MGADDSFGDLIPRRRADEWPSSSRDAVRGQSGLVATGAADHPWSVTGTQLCARDTRQSRCAMVRLARLAHLEPEAALLRNADELGCLGHMHWRCGPSATLGAQDRHLRRRRLRICPIGVDTIFRVADLSSGRERAD